MDINNYLNLAVAVAKSTSRNWDAINWEDVHSEILVWLYNPKTIKYLTKCEFETNLTNELRAAEGKHPVGDGRPYVSMRNTALKYIVKETEHMIGDKLHTNNHYNKAQVAAALPIVLQNNFFELEMNSDSDSLAYSVAADIYSAFWGLSQADIDILILRYKDDLTFETMAEMLDKPENTVTKATHRALDRLTNKLSGTPIMWVPDNVEAPPADYY